jgi:hypothetical protein
MVNGLLAGLMGAIVAFFFVWIIETDFRVGNLFSGGQRKKPARKVTEEQSKKRTKLAAFFTPLFWERAGFALLSGLLLGVLVRFLLGPKFGDEYALINGLFIAAFEIVLGRFERTIHPAEKLVWSWKSVRDHAMTSLLIGLGIGILGGVFDAYPYFQHLKVFLDTLYYWLSLGVALGLIIMVMRGFSSNELDTDQVIKPNQGIRNSLSNSLRLGLSSGALLGGVIFFFYSYVMHNVFVVGYINDIPENADIVYGVGDAVAVAYLFWLINGGFATVQHLMLRIQLWISRCTPWRYPRFLDYAHERILLRKVGGSYMFVHKLLLEYFANLEMEEATPGLPVKIKRPETVPSPSEAPGKTEEIEAPTATLVLIPVLSETPRLLPCGHEQRDPRARFCSICGRPVEPESLDQ